LKKKVKLQPSWVWRKEIEDFVRGKIIGKSLNICAGKSPLGDVKVDLDPQNSSVIKGDMKKLPFPDESFDTVIQDPPWKIGYFDRWQIFFECVRVCRIGGRIIYNAYWIPESKLVELQEIIVRQDGAFTNSSVISIFKRITPDEKT